MNKTVVAGFFALTCLITLVNNDVSLWDQDEAAYAGFGRTMERTGNWLIPEFMWSEPHRKPPLHFWNIALSFKFFGENEFAARLPAALSVLFTYWIIFLWGRRIFGSKQAFYGAIIASTTLFIPVLAKVSVTDGTLLLFTTACALSLFQIMENGKSFWILIFWVAFSLALLLKGPPIILFTAILGVLLLLLHPERNKIWRLKPWFFLPLACLPLFGWGYITWKQHPEFIRWMIDWYILKRVSGSVFGQSGPPGTHLLLIILFFIPWIALIPKAFLEVIRNLRYRNKNSFYLAIWFVAAWLIYELTPSKLPAYVVGAHIPLALLCAQVFLSFSQEERLPSIPMRIIQVIFAGALAVAICIVPFILKLSLPYKIVFISCGCIYLLLLLLAAFANDSSKWFRRQVIANTIFQLMLWGTLLRIVDPLKDAPRQIGNYTSQHLPKSATVYIGNNEGHPPSLIFYVSEKNKVEEEIDNQRLLENYLQQEHVGMILRKEQYDFMKSNIPTLTARIFNQQLTDREQKTAYYVVIK